MPRKPKIVVQISDTRTGSTVLHDALDSHPDVFCVGEVFGQYGDYWFLQRKGMEGQRGMKWELNPFFDSLIAGQVYLQQGSRVLVFKVMYHQIRNLSLMSRLKASNLRVIHLVRRNCVKRALSKLRADNLKVVVPPPWNLLRLTLEGRNNVLKFKRSLTGMSVLPVVYEQMFAQTDVLGEVRFATPNPIHWKSENCNYLTTKLSTQLCHFLGVKVCSLWSRLVKRPDSEDAWEAVKQSPDVRRVFRRKGVLALLNQP